MVIKNPIRHFTRKIVVGATIGGAPLLTVGSAIVVTGPVMAAAQTTEKQEVARILASRDPQAVEAFLFSQGTSPYCASLLNALPPNVLVQISRYTIAGLSPDTVSHLTRRTRAALARSFNQGDQPAPDMQQQPRSSPSPTSGSSNQNSGSRGGY